ncbi:MAG: hypothetical protein ACRENS_02650 [Candidatus Eiseniibacteriota bacterium]
MKILLDEVPAMRRNEERRMDTVAPRGNGRRRGRPLDMAPEEVLDRIRTLAGREGGLFRIHLIEPPLYARARRLFGSWQGAVRAAGFDYVDVLEGSRRRAVQARRSKRNLRLGHRGAR